MEYFHNITSQAHSYDYIDHSIVNDNDTDHGQHTVLSIMDVVTCIIICIGLPLTLLGIYGFYSLVRNDQVAPIYIINLLISDLIQFCSMIVHVATKPEDETITKSSSLIHVFALMSSICFMVCVSMERYLAIAWPVWYHFRRNIKTSVAVCVMVWVLPLVFLLPLYLEVDTTIRRIIVSIFLLFPLPLFIFSLVGTCKALSTSRVPSDEKRRIIAILVVVLLTYILLFLPIIISYLKDSGRPGTFRNLSLIFLRLSPLADVFLYVFSRKGAVDRLLPSLCFCCVNRNDIDKSTDQQSE